MSDTHDSAQVCLTGHFVNTRAGSAPQLNRDFCGKCGAKTFMDCRHCNALIHGDRLPQGSVPGAEALEPDEFCHKCGKAYPWKGKIERSEKRKTLYQQWKERILDNKLGAIIVLVVMVVTGAFAIIKELPDEVKKFLPIPGVSSANKDISIQKNDNLKVELSIPKPELDKIRPELPAVQAGESGAQPANSRLALPPIPTLIQNGAPIKAPLPSPAPPDAAPLQRLDLANPPQLPPDRTTERQLLRRIIKSRQGGPPPLPFENSKD